MKRSLATIKLADGRHLAYREYGAPDGRPVVFFHGNLNSRMFRPLWHTTDEATAACGVRVIAVDRPGYGGSTHHPERTYAKYAADIEQLLGALDLQRVVLAGYSSGGPNALGVASQLPQHVVSCALFSSDGPYTAMGVEYLAKMFGGAEPTYAALAERAAKSAAELKASYANAKPARVPLLMEDIDTAVEQGTDKGPAQDGFLESRDWEFNLADVRCPVVVYHGRDDPDVPPAAAEHIAAQLPDATLVMIDGENHSLVRRKWVEVLTAAVEKGFPAASM